MSGWQFPQWNYGYTQMPAYGFPPGPGHPPPYYAQAPPQPRPPAPAPPPKPPAPQVKVETPGPAVIKKEAVITKTEVKPEEGEIVEKSVLGILRGRNPVMFCNDQSKMRNLHMEWEQISEIGPPHDKTYEYQLKMGEMTATGVGKNKKDAKTKAAEGMVLKLDELPKVGFKRPFHQGGWGHGHGGGWGRGGYHGGGPPWKRRKGESEEDILKQNDVTPKAENPSQNNPISKLHEFAKKRRWSEPIFDCTSEEVLEERRTEKGFTLRKTNFTMRCTVRKPPGQGEDSVYIGNALTKKQAKTNAAAAAWAEIGAGVSQASVVSLLSSQRSGAAASATSQGPGAIGAPASAPRVASQPKVVSHR